VLRFFCTSFSFSFLVSFLEASRFSLCSPSFYGPLSLGHMHMHACVYTTRMLRNAGCRDAWAPHSHPGTNAQCAAMTIRPYKPRDSARSVLLTVVRYRRSRLGALPCTPEGYYTALRPLTD